MKIRFKKGKKGTDVLECVREDGTVTWSHVRPGMMVHELLHYAVETELGFKNAFYGILAKGYGIEEFESDRSKRPTALMPKNLPKEAHWAEIIVGLFQTQLSDRQKIESFREMIEQACTMRGLAPPDALTEENYEKVWQTFQILYKKWKHLEWGEDLVVDF